MGFRTAAIARGKDKEPLARQLGAAHYIDSQAADPAAELAKLGGAKVVLATVTHGPAMSATVGGLAPRGRLMVLGAAESLETSPLLLIGGRRSVEGWYAGTSIDSEDTLAFSVQSGVRSMNEVYPLERAAEAYDRMMSGKALPGRADDVKPGGLNDDAPRSCHGRRGPGWRRGRPRRGGAAAARPARPRHGAARGRAAEALSTASAYRFVRLFSRNRSSLSQSRPLRSSLMPDEDASIECQRTRAR